MSLLDQLAPLIEPQPVSWWPPAPGWWILVVLLIGITVLLAYKKPRRQRRRHATAISEPPLEAQRQIALDELAQLQKPYDDEPANQWLQQLNALLKRLCRIRYPDNQSHTLSGRAWLAFLDSRCPAAGLTRWMILVEGVYRAECHLDDREIQGLEQAVATWIRKHV